VDLDTLITSPGIKVKNYKRSRKPTIAIILLIIGGIVSALILGVMFGKLRVEMLRPGTSNAVVTYTQVTSNTLTFTTSTQTPITPTQTPIIPTQTPVPPIQIPNTVKATNSCPNPITVHLEPGKDGPPFIGEDGTPRLVAIGETVTIVEKRKLSEPNDHNLDGFWLLIYPQGKEEKGWISNEDCLNIPLEVINTLPES
jgi:hypothetical protein